MSPQPTSDDQEFQLHRARVQPMRLLVVDDQQASRMLMQYALDRAGHQSTTCQNGERALEYVSDTQFDAILLDMHMPGMNGLELLAKLRAGSRKADAADPDVAVVFVTGDRSEEMKRDAERMHAIACLAKPLVISELLGVLEAVGAAQGKLQAPPAA